MNDFLVELKQLLKKHDVSIDVDYDDCSDTHGIYDEAIVFSDSSGKEILRVDGWSLDHSDIEVEIDN